MAAVHSTRMQAPVASSRVTRACSLRPALPARRLSVVRAQQQQAEQTVSQVSTAVALTTAASTLLYSGNALAATELVQLAASDNRVAIIATLFVPALGWVAFNALQPLLNQVDKMAEKNQRSVAAAIGMGAASLLFAEHADAATEVAQLAASDNRVAIIATLFLPALGWVAFNALPPLLNQIGKMNEKNQRSVAAATGLGAASLLFAEHADAATEVAQLAASDNRIAIIATLFVPALGWVAFNALQPLLNQVDKMAEKNQRSIAAATGVGAASLLFAEHADAATEVAQLAASDNRVAIIATLFVPALGWVAFNALQPLLNQVDKMAEKNK